MSKISIEPLIRVWISPFLPLKNLLKLQLWLFWKGLTTFWSPAAWYVISLTKSVPPKWRHQSFCLLYRGHKDRLTDVEGDQAGSRYSELSTLKIGESLDPHQQTSSQQSSKKSNSRHRRHSGSVPESALGYGDTTTEGAIGLESNTSSEHTSGHRRRSLSDSRTRSSGKFTQRCQLWYVFFGQMLLKRTLIYLGLVFAWFLKEGFKEIF